MFMACDGDKSSSFNYSGIEFLNFDKPLLLMGMNDRLLYESEKQIETKVLDGKFTGEIIITPNCLDGIIYDIQSNFLSDAVLINGTSIYKNSLDKQVASPMVTILSCPTEETLPGGSFLTPDGYTAQNMPIIENGILKNFVLSRYGAK
jgi:PmbA protein